MAQMAEFTDEEIVSKIQQGESELFEAIINRYEDKIGRYARKFLLTGDDMKDVVQDVFIKAYINIRSFDTGRKFSSWLYRIAHNEFINTIGKRSKMPFIPLDPDTIFPHPIAKETADDDLHKKELREALDESLAKIDWKYREPMVLYYFEEMEYSQISEVLGIPTSTVGVRLKRGKDLLKKIVEGKYENGKQ